ncbi:FAD-dependent monooxygenase [Nocardia asiatica]|uniref:FAD-dependent monooxygenase n=1 Tax=Nocardia asiatica TaxID=209252 RepID=UPI002453E547|nr:FAD-dependent monooxygenase [Nocardia asiatica]
MRPVGSERDAEVVIVGAGPVGLTLASLLGRYGVSTIVLERHDRTVVESRAAVLDGESLRILYSTGLGDELSVDMITGYGHFSVTSSGETMLHVHPSTQPHGYPFLSWIHQPLVESTLCAGLERFDCVAVAFGHEVETIGQNGANATVTAKTRTGESVDLTTRFVIGCDGAASTVRRLLGIAFTGSTYEERWLVVDWENDESGLPGGSWFYADRHGPTISARMPGKRRRWEFALRQAGVSDAEALGDDYIAAMIARYTDPGQGVVARKTVYRFHDRQAQRWREGRVLLAGDAAHVMPPFAGLGLNNGLRDAANLAWKLAAVCAGADPGLLDSYEAERRPIVIGAARTAVRVGALTITRNPLICTVRDRVLLAANTTRWWRKTVLENRIERWPRYRKGAVSGRRCRHTGALLPQPGVEILDAKGEVIVQPLDTVLRGRWSLLGDEQAIGRVDPDQRETLAAAGIQLVAWSRTLKGVDRIDTVRRIRDYDAMARWLVRHHDHLLLVRPDMFVYDCLPPTSTATLSVTPLPLAPTGPRANMDPRIV